MSNKLISQLASGAANVQDTDVLEGQKSGEFQTKQFTGAQIRGVEKAERQAQDDVIENSVGLDANGTFTPPATSWYLRAADFLAGCIDRGGATGALVQNIVNALRLLDAKINALTGSSSVLKAGLSSDVSWNNLVPARTIMEYIIIEELTGQSPILSLGTTAGGNEVLINKAITPSGLTTIFVGNLFSLTAAQTLYLNHATSGDTWDGSTINITFVFKTI